MEIKDFMLKGEGVKKPVLSPNHSGKFEKGLPDTVILHFTSGNFRAALNTFTNPREKASAHIIIDRDGSITQLVPFDTIAWHAGRSSYGGRVGYNKYSIGIEMVNSGPLRKSGNVYRSWFGTAYNPSDVIQAIHRNEKMPKYWHTYTEEQIQAVTELCTLLVHDMGVKHILGHEEIAPSRKSDPGPAFPLDKLRSKLLSSDRSEDGEEALPETGRILANSLNIRELPKASGAKVAQPLKKGAKVKIIDQDGKWFKVATEVVGWVYGDYVETKS